MFVFIVRDVMDVFVVDFGVDGVVDVVYGYDDVVVVVVVLFVGDIWGQGLRSVSMGGEGQGVFDGELGEVYIDFGSVDGFSFVVGVYFFGCDVVVVYVSGIVDVDIIGFISDRFEEC